MQRIAGILMATLLVLTGCSSVSEPGSNQDVRNSDYRQKQSIRTVPAQIRLGQSSVSIEKMAIQQNCQPVAGAELIYQQGAVEDYQVNCIDGRQLASHCEYRQCAFNATSQVPAGAIQLAQVQVTQNSYPAENGMTSSPTATSPTTHGYAEPQKPIEHVYGVVGLGGAFGGDNLATLTYTNGQTATLDAGRGAQVVAGVEYRYDENFSIQSTINYQVVFATGASNGSASFSRIPVEIIGDYTLAHVWRLGAGVRFDERTQVNASGVAAPLATKFSKSVGSIFEVEYLITPHLGLKLRAIKETMSPEGSSYKINANQVGLFTNYYF